MKCLEICYIARMLLFGNKQLPSLEEINPRLKLRVSKRARRMALRLDNKTNEMHLVVPERANMHKAYVFAQSHAAWIQEKLDDLPVAVPFVDGAVIPLFGDDVTLDIYLSDTLKRTNISLKNNIISIKTNKENPSSRITRFLREEARTRLAALAEDKAAQIDKTVTKVQVRDTKSRWGSCSPDGTLSFSWRIAFAPYESFDYLVAHEVAHLIHKNHSKDFWGLCEDLSTDYKTGKNWIRRHGHTLMRYG